MINPPLSLTKGMYHSPLKLSSLGPEVLSNVTPISNLPFLSKILEIQPYLSIKPDQTNHLVKLEACLEDIKTCITSNFLWLNSDITEVIVLGSEHLRKSLSQDIIAKDCIAMCKLLGLSFFTDITKMWHILSYADAEKIIKAFVTSGPVNLSGLSNCSRMLRFVYCWRKRPRFSISPTSLAPCKILNKI